MGEVARNSLKGYSYQQSVFILFLALMDTERVINKITVEALDTMNFDDIYIQTTQNKDINKDSYRIQVKNYVDTKLEDINIFNDKLIIKGNANKYDPNDSNVLVVNTLGIETNDTFMGMNCIRKKDIIIIPLTPSQVAEKLDNLFNYESRELQIIHFADDITQNAIFEVTIEDLPDVIQMSVELENETVLLRKVPESFDRHITYIEGKPGVGKSHYVNEICKKYPDAIVYRFWIGSQDPNKNRRIVYENFISEIGIKVYKNAKKVIIEDLIKTIREDDKLIIIDGLDHVENYNPQQLEEFINFIDKLQGIRAIVLSRPLKYDIIWKKNILMDWTFEETRIYLELAHKITDYHIQNQIFEYTHGYPIVSYFVAEDYKIKHRVDGGQPILGLNDYYDRLFINNDRPSAAIGVFATGNCFFTCNELKNFFTEPEMYEAICEFIDLHPYLFKIVLNRISLIHDSLNTYLKTKISTFQHRKEKTLSIIRNSLLDGDVEYMDRMQSFDFDNEFYNLMILKYVSIDNFKELIMCTRDYNSIQSLYNQLQILLEDRKGLLDIYQYYSFSLLLQVVNRNDLIGNDSFVIQMLIYMKNHDGIEDCIYSSDYIWQVYLTCKNMGINAQQYLSNKRISESQYYDLIENINRDFSFYEKKEMIFDYSELQRELREDIHSIKKDDILADYLISTWIHGSEHDKFYNEFVDYLQNKDEYSTALVKELSEYKFDRFWIDSSMSKAKYQLHELGYFDENNKFRNSSLLEMIKKGAVEGSYSAVTLAASYMKLANYEHREIDISSLAYAWAMYYEHKDYSVFTIDTALITVSAT